MHSTVQMKSIAKDTPQVRPKNVLRMGCVVGGNIPWIRRVVRAAMIIELETIRVCSC